MNTSTTNIIESGCAFKTFSEARAAIEKYAAQTNTYNGTNEEYTTKPKEFVITKAYLEHNYDVCIDVTK
ncbi:1816_t:CDS:2 [Racocetra fulgida]|uniref:1816_t:CDS:1 n=1 Tax=Racocetra fulgida TaxID=60492 RepID=A0A9N9A8F0_9GLOM|nr:1816_t:CDS:2 [Racocetra fulgida]